MNKVHSVLLSTTLFTLTSFFGLLTYKVYDFSNRIDKALPKVLATLEERDKQLELLLTNVAEVSTSTNKLATDTYWDNYANIQRVGVMIGNVNKTIVAVNEEVIPSTNQTLAELRLLGSSTRSDLNTLTKSLDTSLNKLPVLLDKTEALVGTSELQLQGNGEMLSQALQSLQKATDDADKLITSEDTKKVLVNVEKTTKHVGEAAESIDTALQPLRKKAGFFKRLGWVALGMLRVDLARF
jgi:ABC-type transporter Mla subunit MlaD